MRHLLASLATILLVGSSANAGEPRPAAGKVDFATQIKPLLNKHCTICHGGVKTAKGLSLIVRDKAVAETKRGTFAIKPGAPNESELMARITAGDDERMPPAEHGPPLAKDEIELFRRWIAEGAPWAEHWAFRMPRPQPLPKVSDAGWGLQPLDAFVLARLDREGLTPSPPSARAAWLRRVSLDLTGVPPTPEEVRAFLADTGPRAYETVVDRLLASPRYGERWASLWLDLARYADTAGYESDPGRTVWPYRDWLIRAFNADTPFDQFTVKQIAGDLLPDATTADRMATTFHRNTPTNVEGGTDDEEFRTAAVIDRVNTTWEVWQAVTIRCVQCHNHPYEPIEHDEFYRVLALFNTTRDSDLSEEYPLLKVPTREADRTRVEKLDRELARLRTARHEPGIKLAAEPKQWHHLRPDKATSTGSAKLAIRDSDGVPEVVAGGTISSGSRFTLEAPVPVGVERLAALRIDVLPTDVEAARSTSELGFVLSRLRLEVLPPGDGAKPREVAFTVVFDDNPDSVFAADGSLNDDAHGWSAYTRFNHPRRAVFVPDEAADLPAGSRVRLTLAHDVTATAAFPLVIRRARFAVAQGDAWQKLVKSPDFQAVRKQLADAEHAYKAIPGANVPVMAEQSAPWRRSTRVFVRGNWLDKGDEVTPGVPKLFPQFPKGATADRLALGRWLVSPDNPLTARVAVNRFWEQLFGIGLVETVEDFGTSGTPPSHPALLDHLAVRFQGELGWSVKKLLREIVLSAAYRQDAKVTPELLRKDPQNRLLARGPRIRLSAEMVRDQALAASGLLAEKAFGPPVMPPQPEGVWRSVYSGARWETATGEDRFRRAVYTYCKRTAGYPSFQAFDLPGREVCTARRIRTNTPLQALVTLNDPVYVECAVALAGRMAAAGPEPEQRIAKGYELVLGRLPSAEVLRDLTALHDEAAAHYAKNPKLAAKLADTPERAALAVVANAVLNLDEVLTK